MSYNSNTVLSWSNSRALNFYRLSQISSEGIFDIDGKTSSHLESNSWIFQSWRVTEQYHERQSLESSRRSCKRSVFREEPILLLSFLFLQTDLFIEVGILDDLVQRRCNSRVQHLKIQEMSTTLNWSRWFLNHPPNRPTPLLWSMA